MEIDTITPVQLRTPPNEGVESASPYTSLWALDPATTHLDHGAFGSVPLQVQQVQSEIRSSIERDPHNFFERKYPTALQNAKQCLARFINAPLDGLALLSGCTHALNVVIQSQTFEPGDEILTTNHKYSSVGLILDYVVKRDQARVVIADVPFPIASEDQLIQSILCRVTPRTKFAIIDHIPSRSAIIFPVQRLVQLLETRGITVLVDGAHVPGNIVLDVGSIQASYYVANCHKWMCAPRGVAFISVRSDKIDTIKPVIYARTPWAHEPEKHNSLEHAFDWVGTLDPSAWLSLPATIDFLEHTVEGGYAGLTKRNRDLALRARQEVCNILGTPFPSPADMIASMVTLPLPDFPFKVAGHLPLQKNLWARHGIEIPVYAWPLCPKRVMRFSVQLYNHLGEYIYMAHCVKSLLKDEQTLHNMAFNEIPQTVEDFSRSPIESILDIDSPISNGERIGTPDPYVANEQLCSIDSVHRAAIKEPSFGDLVSLAVERVFCLANNSGEQSTCPLQFPYHDATQTETSPRQNTCSQDSGNEMSRLICTLSNVTTRGPPSTFRPLLQEIVESSSVLDAWQSLSSQIQGCSEVTREAILKNVQSRAGTEMIDVISTYYDLVFYPTDDVTTNLGLILFKRCLVEIESDMTKSRFSRLRSFLEIHAFLNDPIKYFRQSYERQQELFVLLFSSLGQRQQHKQYNQPSMKLVAAQLAHESSYLSIKRLHRVAYIHFAGRQQLPYVYVKLHSLSRSELAVPSRVLQLMVDILETSLSSPRSVEIAPILIAYCPSLESAISKPNKVVIDGNNRVTAMLLLHFLGLLESADLTYFSLTAQFTTYAQQYRLCCKCRYDILQVLQLLCDSRELLQVVESNIMHIKSVFSRQEMRVPAVLVQESRFQTVWNDVGGTKSEGEVEVEEKKKKEKKILQPMHQSLLSMKSVNLAIPAKGQSHGRTMGYRLMPLM